MVLVVVGSAGLLNSGFGLVIILLGWGGFGFCWVCSCS